MHTKALCQLCCVVEKSVTLDESLKIRVCQIKFSMELA
jgi:hypothetical protein